MPRSLGRYTFSTLESDVSRIHIEANSLIFYGRGSTNEVVLMNIIVPTLGRLLLVETSDRKQSLPGNENTFVGSAILNQCPYVLTCKKKLLVFSQYNA